METDRENRPHFRTSSSSSAAATTSELFICFTSRLSSSSSMKLSKSILSPGRAARDGGPASLSSSLSRRLRTSGSVKGSPFITTSGKKRGCGFDNPEPSSPKVTCIGQVRVKTKKKVKQSRSLSKRRSGGGGGEVSFRKIEQQQPCADVDDKVRYSNASAHYQAAPPQECRNQRWVHLPISICEALRTLGAEFSCLFPCLSTEKGGEKHGGGDENGCGATFARWLVSVNDGEGGKRREIELVVGGGDEEVEEEKRVSMRTSRRHVLEDFEVKDDRIELKGGREEEEPSRVGICIPPKNALLLMRCRSDPMKMAALTNRFSLDANNQNQDTQQQEEEEVEEEIIVVDAGHDIKDRVFEQEIAFYHETPEEKEDITNEVEEKLAMEGDVEEKEKEEELEIRSEEMVEAKTGEIEMVVAEGENAMVVEDHCQEEEALVVDVEQEEVEEKEEEDEVEEKEKEDEEVESNMSSFEALLEQEKYQDCCPVQEEEEAEEDTAASHPSPSTQSDEETLVMDKVAQESVFLSHEEENQDTTEEKEEEGEEVAVEVAVAEEEVAPEPKAEEKQEKEELVIQKNGGEKKGGRSLPECLLLMMCEPKLSMEVSKETWVCSTDFMRWLPERPRRAAPKATEKEPAKRRLSIDSKPPKCEPPRSSCSLSMATMIEQKLVNAVAYEPFVLTRCKSEPMRTAASKLTPDSCFWKNAVRKLEPAGVGF